MSFKGFLIIASAFMDYSSFKKNKIFFFISKFFFQLFGQAAVSMDQEDPSKAAKFTISIVNIIYSFILMIVYIICFTNSMNIPIEDTRIPKLATMGHQAQLCISLVVYLSCSLLSYRSGYLLGNFIVKIMKIDEGLLDICDKETLDYNKERSFQVIYLTCAILIIVTITIYDVFAFGQ